MKKFSFASLLALPAIASAQSLLLEYSVEDIGGGLYQYEFCLSTDDGWAPGMGWRWFIFGDEPGTGSGGTGVSPLTGFVGDPASLPIGPWTFYTSSGGGHNGPTLGGVLDYWIPATGDEVLTWRGTSTANLGEGELLFSSLAGTLGGAVAPNFAVATLKDGGADCYADCDGDGQLTIFDFLCFQNAFASGDPYADCDGDGAFTIFDFLCFQNAFAEGCD